MTKPKLCIEERFIAFHLANPHVFQKIESLVRAFADKGRKRIGMKMLFEVMRWNWFMETGDPNSEFKLANDYTSRYARLVMQRHPEWTSLFELRELKAA